MRYDTLGYIRDIEWANHEAHRRAVEEIRGLRPSSRFPEHAENVKAWEEWRNYEMTLRIERFTRDFEEWLKLGAPFYSEGENEHTIGTTETGGTGAVAVPSVEIESTGDIEGPAVARRDED